MQERIPAQINVNKETGGCSRVQILLSVGHPITDSSR